MPLLSVRDLQIDFTTRNGRITAVNGIGFDVEPGQITAIIGESGSGKSVACYSLLGLLPTPPASIERGSAVFDGRDLLQISERELREIRGRDIAMIFQDPMTCLNPYMTVGNQLVEPLIYHRKVTRAQARERALELLAEVGLRDPQATIDQYPHQFSGGMRQRVMIAMALINEPRLLIADEPTTALDVTIQAQILELIAELQRKRNIGVIFISHDLSVVADIADEIVVMEKGHVVERGDRQAIFQAAEHPYTQKLLAAIPAGSKPPADAAREDLIQVRNLCTWFSQGRGAEPLRAVDDVSFTVQRGEVLGLVGESG
ncbi:MAG: ABC transporter ATP-binding protein, partial [Haliea sp.]|nr:ABC transporter ATP-binding protein [Haliea sp.]